MNKPSTIKVINRNSKPIFSILFALIFFLIASVGIGHDARSAGVYILCFSAIGLVCVVVAAHSYKATEIDYQLRKISFVYGFFGPERRNDNELEPLQYVELFSKKVSVTGKNPNKSHLMTYTGVRLVGADTFEFCLLPEFDRAKRYAIRLCKRLNCPLIDKKNDKAYVPEQFQLSLGDKLRSKAQTALHKDDNPKNVHSDTEAASTEMNFSLPLLHNNSYYAAALCASVLSLLTFLSAILTNNYYVPTLALIILVWSLPIFLRHRQAKSLEHHLQITPEWLYYQSGLSGKINLALNSVEDMYVQDNQLFLMSDTDDIIINFSDNKESMEVIYGLLLEHFKSHG